MTGYVYRDPERTRRALTDAMTVERFAPEPEPPHLTRAEQQLADLRQVIHLLAMLMNNGKAVA